MIIGSSPLLKMSWIYFNSIDSKNNTYSLIALRKWAGTSGTWAIAPGWAWTAKFHNPRFRTIGGRNLTS